MKTRASIFLRFAAAVLAAGFLCSCESDKVKDKIDDVKDKAGLNDNEEGGNVSGVWSGRSGSGQWRSVMTLTERPITHAERMCNTWAMWQDPRG